jgi:hypothetical protein
MASSRRPKGSPAVVQVRDRLLLIIGFLESVQDFPAAEQFREIIQDAAGKGNLRGLRLLSRDVEAMAATLAPHERDGLEALLESRLGIDRDAERAQMRESVAHALRRGSVASEKERRRLEEYAEMLEATGGDAKELAEVRRLLMSG